MASSWLPTDELKNPYEHKTSTFSGLNTCARSKNDCAVDQRENQMSGGNSVLTMVDGRIGYESAEL
jgi:hypothetical protein